MKECSESASVGAEAVQVHKHPNALEPVDSHGTPLIKSCSKPVSEEKGDDGNSIREQCSESASEIEGPVGAEVVQVHKHPNALEPASEMKTYAWEGDVMRKKCDYEFTLSSVPSTLVEEKNVGSTVTCLVRSSEPLEESMEKGVANNSGVQEAAKVDRVETDVQMDSSISQTIVNLSSHLMTKEENVEDSQTSEFKNSNV
ncbi:hypothetical protein VNO78_21499 [Psophocarpus tetragonolobus]|uniref:Uncharacterized protein n=1 Tax=Psophocarpus tetragonolobus TaxID=3891 RepID=A0AAN9SFF2_PSOTE